VLLGGVAGSSPAGARWHIAIKQKWKERAQRVLRFKFPDIIAGISPKKLSGSQKLKNGAGWLKLFF
jgi:hypothetical protein